jgi:hypothetical protein
MLSLGGPTLKKKKKKIPLWMQKDILSITSEVKSHWLSFVFDVYHGFF